MFCIIYKITNIINEKLYIGQTWTSLSHRFGQHSSSKKKNKLFCAFQKYGKDNFKIECLTVCGTQEVADYWESYFITKYNSIKMGYNIREGGSRGKHSLETRRKMSVPNKNKSHIAWNKNLIGVMPEPLHKGKRTISTTLSKKGTIPWNTGTKGIMIAWNKNRNGNDRLFSKEKEIIIANDKRSSRVLAKEYGVSRSLILKIRKRYKE